MTELSTDEQKRLKRNEKALNYYYENKEKILARLRKNKQYYKEYQKEYYNKNRRYLIEYNKISYKRYYYENRESILAKSKNKNIKTNNNIIVNRNVSIMI